jgi:hypothetical protein
MQQDQICPLICSSWGVLTIRISTRPAGWTRDEPQELEQQRHRQGVDHDRHQCLPIRGVVYDWQGSTAKHSAKGPGERVANRNHRADEANILGGQSPEDKVECEDRVHHCQAKPD